MNHLNALVTSKTLVATDIVQLELAPTTAGSFPDFTAGSHIDVKLPGESVRQYSLCNAPSDRDRYVIAVKKEIASRGGSSWIHGGVDVGDILSISPPRNHFGIAEGGAHHLLFAGGIGVTPLISMARQLLVLGRSFHLHYFVRSREHGAFLDEIESSPLKVCTTVHVGVEPAQLRIFLRRSLWKHTPDTHLYVCGPGPFMKAVLGAATAWPTGTVHREFFSNASLEEPHENHQFQVRLARSRCEVSVSADESVVRALASAGVTVPTSCEQGTCGTCLVGLIAGAPDHRDAYLTDEEKLEGRSFIPCVSRAKDDSLTLDL